MSNSIDMPKEKIIKFIPEFTKVRFMYDGSEKIGYIYHTISDRVFVSENRTLESIGLGQNWVINKRDVLEQLI